MNSKLNLNHNELVSELFHVMQDAVLEQYTNEDEYTDRLKVLWDYLENSNTESLEVLYNVYY